MAENTTDIDVKNDEDAAHLASFLRQYTPIHAPRTPDLLENRYRIEINDRLQQFDSPHAKAYGAIDLMDNAKQLFALVCEQGTLQRHRVAAQLKGVVHPNIMPLITSGVAMLSQPQQERFVIIYEQPAGRRFSEVLRNTVGQVNSTYICRNIIAPLASALQQFADLDISHGTLNPDTIYFSDTPVLGDCVSEPCGYSQPFYYEPLERLQAHHAAKGEGSTAQDYYSLAVMVLSILHGANHFNNMTQEKLIHTILRHGAYNALTLNKDVPVVFYDFFRGMLSQGSHERWNYRYLKPWLEGKRYNVLLPPPPADALRPFEFGEHSASTKRELAQLLYQDWAHIPLALKDDVLHHWVAISLRNKELAEQIGKITRTVSEMGAREEIQLNEQLMRVVMLFDPMGPIRFASLAFHVDGLDSLCVELFITKSEANINLLARFIEFNMVTFWSEQQAKIQNYVTPKTVNDMLLRLDRMRVCIRNTGFGFGTERLMYELNPDMPCQSPLCAGLYINTLAAMLKHLDSLASKLAREQDPIDRHIAAFMASKLNIQHDLRLNELSDVPALATSRSMLSLRFISMAQNRLPGDVKLPGLAYWLALRISPLLDNIRSKTLRKHVKAAMIEHTREGYTQKLAQLLINPSYTAADHDGFARAWHTYHDNIRRIALYKSGELLDRDSTWLGSVVARSIAYLGFIIVLWDVIRHA